MTRILTPKFRLSNRQAKELVERGTPLQIAIPVPAHVDPATLDTQVDGLLFASVALHLPDGAKMVDAWLDRIPVSSNVRPGGTGLSAAYGHIIGEGEMRPASHLILAVVVDIQPPGTARHKSLPTQWPGAIQPIGETDYL